MKSVIILGKGQSRASLDELIALQPDCELWTLNDDRHPRATRHFEVHSPRHHITEDIDIPVYRAAGEVRYRNERVFPWEQIQERFPDCEPPGNSVSCMLAVAALERFNTVALPGCDFTGGTREFTDERRSTAHWCGILIGAGARLLIPADSALLKGKLYT